MFAGIVVFSIIGKITGPYFFCNKKSSGNLYFINWRLVVQSNIQPIQTKTQRIKMLQTVENYFIKQMKTIHCATF